MKTLWHPEARLEIVRRVGNVHDEMLPKWGKFSAAAMLAHLVQSIGMSVGEVTAAPKNMPVRYFPLKQLAIYVIPMPHGTPTLPELLVESPLPCARSAAEIERLLGEFVSRQAQKEWPDHPAFGSLDAKGWGALMYKHFDHHLRQFGV